LNRLPLPPEGKHRKLQLVDFTKGTNVCTRMIILRNLLMSTMIVHVRRVCTLASETAACAIDISRAVPQRSPRRLALPHSASKPSPRTRGRRRANALKMHTPPRLPSPIPDSRRHTATRTANTRHRHALPAERSPRAPHLPYETTNPVWDQPEGLSSCGS
jgi:hypothetical protein